MHSHKEHHNHTTPQNTPTLTNHNTNPRVSAAAPNSLPTLLQRDEEVGTEVPVLLVHAVLAQLLLRHLHL